MTKCTTTLGIIGAEGVSMKGDYMNKFRHVSRKEKVQLASRARQILDDAAREQELDIPIFVTPAQMMMNVLNICENFAISQEISRKMRPVQCLRPCQRSIRILQLTQFTKDLMQQETEL